MILVGNSSPEFTLKTARRMPLQRLGFLLKILSIKPAIGCYVPTVA